MKKAKDHTGDVRGFYHYGSSWYAKIVSTLPDDIEDEIMIGLYSPDGGTSG